MPPKCTDVGRRGHPSGQRSIVSEKHETKPSAERMESVRFEEKV